MYSLSYYPLVMTIEANYTEDLTYNERVGLEIKTWLIRKRLRQSDLASALSLSQGAISQRLIGNQSFSMNELIVASGLFGITLGELLGPSRSEEHTSELQSRFDLVCRLLLEKKKIVHDM